jgi:hypothetical protein
MRATFLRRAAGALLFSPACLAPLSAAIALDSNWGLVFDVRPEIVYDTNLTARRDNLEDWYGSITPQVTLSRRNSATRFDLDAQVTRTWFDEFDEFDSTDPQVNLHYAYPVGPGDEPRSAVDLHWGRNSATNTDLGRRLRSDRWQAGWEQRLFDTGKTGLDFLARGLRTDYLDETLNTNESLAAGLRASYALSPRARVGLGYTHEWTRSLAPDEAGDIDGDEDRVVLRLSGELLPTLRGSAEAGVAFVSYTGAVDRDETAWVAAANLTWEPHPDVNATLRASRYNDFSPDGGTALRSDLIADVTREVGGGFSLRAGGGVSRLETFRPGFETEADAFILIVGLGYQFTERFSAQLTERYTDQSADRDEFDYERHLVTGLLTFSF